MISFLCLAIPPILLLYIRSKVVGKNEHKTLENRIVEYCFALLFLNFIAISITYLVFHHSGRLQSALNDKTVFAFHYLVLVIVISIIVPMMEYFFKNHFQLNINLSETMLSIRKYDKTKLFYLYVFVLFVMNFIRIFDNSFWADEGYSISLAKMSIADMINATANDVHPPLHYFLIQLMYHIFGNKGFAYHLSGFIPYVFLLIIICSYIRKRFGMLTAFFMVTMCSLMKEAVRYNVEARMYSMGALFVLLAFLTLYEIIKRNYLRDWMIFVIVSLAAAYTHYYALVAVAFFYLALIPLTYRDRGKRRRTIMAYIITVIAYLPWLSILIKSFESTADSWWLNEIPTIREAFLYLFDTKWLSILFVLAVIGYFLYETRLFSIRINETERWIDKVDTVIEIDEKRTGVSEELIWVIAGLCSIFGTCVVGLILSYTIRPFFVLRYLYPTVPVAYMLLIYCTRKMKLKKILFVLILSIVFSSSIPSYFAVLRNDIELDHATTDVLNTIKPSKTAAIFSDNKHLGLSLLPYYFPDNYGKYNENAVEDIDQNYSEIWLFWTQHLDEHKISEINKQSYSCNEIYESKFANGIYFHIYKLEKEN